MSRAGLSGLAILLLSALALSACGGDDDSDDEDGNGQAARQRPQVRLELTRPGADGSEVRIRAESVRVEGTATTNARVSVGGVETVARDGSFVAKLDDLDTGENEVQVEATKRGYRPARASLTIERVELGDRERSRDRSGAAPGARSDSDEEDIERYLEENFERAYWYDAVEEIEITGGRVTIQTDLSRGDPESERAADDACRAVKGFGITTPTFIRGPGDTLIAVC